MVVGGAKVADKIGVLGSLIPKADLVLVGGRMAFTFLAAEGVSVGSTQVESERLKVTSIAFSCGKRRSFLVSVCNAIR